MTNREYAVAVAGFILGLLIIHVLLELIFEVRRNSFLLATNARSAMKEKEPIEGVFREVKSETV